jgi:hypothetical protein
MIHNRKNRRQFLVDASGFALAIPTLGSLLPRTSAAQSMTANKRFLAILTGHGGVQIESMFPSNPSARSSRAYRGHDIHWEPLAPSIEGNDRVLSDVLRGSQGEFPAGLVGKMNVIQGFEATHEPGHNQATPLGNFAPRAGNPSPQLEDRATIDQVMAWSPNFYPDLSGIIHRSVSVGAGRPASFTWSDPANKSGSIQSVSTFNRAHTLFDDLWTAPAGDGPAVERPLVVDRILDSYRRVRDGAFGPARQITAADRQRLDAHMERLLELERKLRTQREAEERASANQCQDLRAITSTPDRPGLGELQKQIDYWETFADALVTGILCGSTRIGVMNFRSDERSTFTDFTGSWHQDVAHEALGSSAAHARMVASKQVIFEKIFCRIARTLDVEEDSGETFLDRSLVMWSDECGFLTHFPYSSPIVTAGSAAGFFQTGNYVDFRNHDNEAILERRGWWRSNAQQKKVRPGLDLRQWLANVLQSMGVQPSEYRAPGETGYGPSYVEHAAAYPDVVLRNADELLPILT